MAPVACVQPMAMDCQSYEMLMTLFGMSAECSGDEVCACTAEMSKDLESMDGTYTVDGNQLTLEGTDEEGETKITVFEFCVQGDELQLKMIDEETDSEMVVVADRE